ncbi:MAG: hypothetical protein WCJ28_00325, partial [Actinomycetota bacterium]
RSQPTLPGVEEAAAANVGISGEPAVPTTPALAVAAPVLKAAEPQMQVSDAPFCYSCGNVMQRAGSCYLCSACGATSGCS